MPTLASRFLPSLLVAVAAACSNTSASPPPIEAAAPADTDLASEAGPPDSGMAQTDMVQSIDGAGTTTPVRLLVLSDPHYYDPALGTTGPAFVATVAHDRKLIAESDAVMRAMVAAVQTENPQVVLIAGDLTKDGEQSSHLRVAAYLRQMQSSGRKVFVVPGNHDIENDGAQSYAGDITTPVPTIAAAEFASIYHDMGYGSALARDPASLSYVAELGPTLWLLALDACIYGEVRAPETSSGRFTDPTKAWIQTQLDLAASQGVRVLAMMHHGVVEHFANQAAIFPEYLVAERDAVAALLSNGGVGAVFTGHFHANDITRGLPSGSARALYDIETGSTVTYPCPYRIVDVASDTLAITTKHITAIDYDLQGAPDLQSYAHDSLRIGLEALIPQLIAQAHYVLTDGEAARISPWLADGLVAHYAGDEMMPADVPREVQAWFASGVGTEVLAGLMLQSIWTDLPPADDTLIIDLAAR
jgi:3',5'-cyclic AMP phosphodiesterase CpdA